MLSPDKSKIQLLISKLLVFALLAALVIPWKAPAAHAADAELVSDDFSSYTEGPLTPGNGNTWTTEGAVPQVNVVPAAEDFPAYAEMTNTAGGSSYIGQRFAAQNGGLIIQFDVNLPKSSGGTLWVMDGKVNATTAAALRYQLDAGVIKRYNAAAQNQISYDTTHWYRFTMVFNTPKNTYDVHIQDLTTGEEVLWPDNFYSSRDKISSFGFYLNPNGGTVKLANVHVTALDTGLIGLGLHDGDTTLALSPAFNPSVVNYSVDVPFSTTALDVVPTASFPEGTSLKVGDQDTDSGQAVQVDLTGDATDIAVAVTSDQYTDIAMTYHITVNRLEKAPDVNNVSSEGHDGSVQIGWDEPADPAFTETHVYLAGADDQLQLADTVPKGQYISAITGLSNNETYRFVVKAAYSYGDEPLAESAGISVSETPKVLPARQMEALNRGLVAIKDSEGVFVSWRLLGTDPSDTAFNVYRDGKRINEEPITDSTNLVDAAGGPDSHYYVRPVLNGKEQAKSETVNVWDTNYLTIPLRKPADGVTPAGETYTYRANDASVGDLDGDGQYEIVLKWDPSNSKDNSLAGYTGNTYVDAYKMDGTLMWRIDLGRNIRSGAHYLDIMVYDLDGDGKAEVTFRTADGTVDGKGNVIGDAAADYRNSSGYVLDGPEYHTVFDGATGEALDTQPYEPARGNVADWGDNYGNRVDRFLSAIAYLDGVHPSVIMQRGYYTRMVLVAYDFKDGKLVKRWTFDSNTPGNESFAGQGNHQLSVADVDNDGKDEIITGAAAIDDDGTALWNSGLGHGDAMHLGDLDPNHLGLELFAVQENTGAKYSADMKDARTGRVLWGMLQTGKDTGRGLSADVDPNHPGEEAWAINGEWNSTNGGLFTADGQKISDQIPSSNFAIWWDGDLNRELLDHDWLGDPLRVGIPKIDKWDAENNRLINLETFTGTYSNNDTKGNPALQADLLGDWREEVVVRTEDSSALRIYSTTDVTDKRIYTLMHDPVYRLGVAWQNTGYNQPPHTSFYLGNGMEAPAQPSIYTVKYTGTGGGDGGNNGGNHDGGNNGGGTGGSNETPGTGSGTDAGTTPEVSFSDIGNHWAAAYITKLVQAGAVNGYADGTFKPNHTITRAEFTSIIVKLLAKSGASQAAPVFADVQPGSWYYDAVMAGYQLGFIQGNDGGTFAPDAPISRQEMAAILERVYASATGDTGVSGEALNQLDTAFSDASSIADWAKAGVAKMAELGVINGFENGTFAPGQNATRAEAAKMICLLAAAAQK
nr:S-layer homology domain-containing protein [Paenibacillus protaetiae]